MEKGRRGPGTVLTEDEELSLVAYIREAQNLGFPRTDADILQEVGKIVSEDGQPKPFVMVMLQLLDSHVLVVGGQLLEQW